MTLCYYIVVFLYFGSHWAITAITKIIINFNLNLSTYNNFNI